jgi:hypothetical protein
LLTITGFDHPIRRIKQDTEDMAAILQFHKKQPGENQDFAPGHSATILLYTGVRFERIDFDALKHREDETAARQDAVPTRLAN